MSSRRTRDSTNNKNRLLSVFGLFISGIVNKKDFGSNDIARRCALEMPRSN